VVISLAFSAVSWASRGRVRRGMRQRRGMNFRGNSYMDWKEKGKGFFRLSGEGGWGYNFSSYGP
jgi:hypothetical protein